ncbi:hypothetical protein [Halobacterium salinarum]|uniref:hypothetical protein n=1 Tax=Halobacterium salinarum TaxID=2242 RepID=UPI0010A57D22|nr:hypothetical protein [Halobacterium salinarum]
MLIDIHLKVGSEFTSFVREFRHLHGLFTIRRISHINLREESFDRRFVVIVGVEDFLDGFCGFVFVTTLQVLLRDEEFVPTVAEAFLFGVFFQLGEVLGCECDTFANIQCSLSSPVDPALRAVDGGLPCFATD